MTLCNTRRTRRSIAGALGLLTAALTCGVTAAATITVNSLADDVMPNAVGAIFDPAGNPVALASPKCTLRMALASANLDMAVGGTTNGCVATGSPYASGAADSIVFQAGLTGTIMLNPAHSMSEAPANFFASVISNPTVQWILVGVGSVSITGPGSGQLKIDGGAQSGGIRRPFLFSGGDGNVDTPVSVTGVSIVNGTSAFGNGGCMFSRESITLTDIIFEGCQAIGYAGPYNVTASSTGTNLGGSGGALGVSESTSASATPSVTLNNVQFRSNRALQGTSSNVPRGGAAWLGGSGSVANPSTNKVGAVSITGTRFLGNSAPNDGGLLIGTAALVSLNDVQFLANSANGSYPNGDQGAFFVYNIAGTTTFTDVFVSGNVANRRRGGGLFLGLGSALASGTALSISGGEARGNLAITDQVGGLAIITDFLDTTSNCTTGNRKNVSISNTSLVGNLSGRSRAGLFVFCSADVSITDSSINNNEVFGITGPVGGDTSATGNAFSAGAAAGQVQIVGNVFMTNVEISNNKTYQGNTGTGSSTTVPPTAPNVAIGGIHNFQIGDATSFTGNGLRVFNNYVDQFGGGLSLTAVGVGRQFLLTQSSIHDNRSAVSAGGLVINSDGTYNIRNTTIAGNQALDGAGLRVNGTSSNTDAIVVNIQNSTIARNYGTNDNAPLALVGSPYNALTNITSSILGGSSGANPGGLNWNSANASKLSISSSLIENGASLTAGFCGANGTLCNLDAKLQALDYNGALAKSLALMAGSPALDTGSNALALTTDQRGAGFPRVVGAAADMGAFESPVLAAALPCKLDMDGDNQVTATKEGLVVLRAMLGLSEATAVAGTGITQGQWNTARLNLNANCGTNFTP